MRMSLHCGNVLIVCFSQSELMFVIQYLFNVCFYFYIIVVLLIIYVLQYKYCAARSNARAIS
jgi:hypothetical protein